MKPLSAAALSLAALLALAGCEQSSIEAPSTGGSVARLASLGFRPLAVDAGGAPVSMSYQGPITGAVQCRGSSGYQPGPVVLSGAKLDAYVQLSRGRVVDGVYAITVRDGSGISGISFAPGETATLASGVACRAS